MMIACITQWLLDTLVNHTTRSSNLFQAIQVNILNKLKSTYIQHASKD